MVNTTLGTTGVRHTKGNIMGYNAQGIGYQNTDTSFDAANDNVEKKLTLREQILDLLKRSSIPLTADSIAFIINKPFISVRPRVTELSADKLIRDSGKRAEGQWGKKCILWEACDDEQEEKICRQSE